MPYNPIQPFYDLRQPGDSGREVDILNAMADMEREQLAFLGLKEAYGAVLPDKLPNVFPCTLHYPAGRTALRPFTTMGTNSLAAHPGGKRKRISQVEIALVVGPRDRELRLLVLQTLFWLHAFDLLYAANGSLAGACKHVKLTSAGWGPIVYAGARYFGWTINAEVEAWYLMNGG